MPSRSRLGSGVYGYRGQMDPSDLSTHLPGIDRIGGKAWSLLRMSAAGLSVPPSFVMDVDFFDPWIAEVRASGDVLVAYTTDPGGTPLFVSADAITEVLEDGQVVEVNGTTGAIRLLDTPAPRS